jgi:hypothetical protein
MSCDGLLSVSPVCLATSGLGSSIVDSVFSSMAGQFGLVASNAASWLWEQIDQATAMDLSSPALLREIAATGSIAVVLCLGLVLIQAITGVLRRDPSALGRAFNGLVISFVGSALALATTRLGLGAVDSLSAGFVQYTAGTNIAGLGTRLQFVALSGIQNPAATLLFAVVIIAAVVVVWAAMMIRKLTLLIAAVLAPLAFSGATADITRNWVRKWIELVAALVASKLLLVIILSIGVVVLDGAGQSGTGAGQGTTQLAAGSLILLLGGFAPWASIKMFSFAGESLYAAHAAVGHAKAGGQAAIAAPQKVATLHSHARALTAPSRSSQATGPRPIGGQPTGAAVQTSRPSAVGVGTAPTAGQGAAGAVGTTGGAAAATGPAAPAIVVAAATAAAAKGALDKAKDTMQSATAATPAQSGPSPSPTQPPPSRGPRP